jgi:hypothetical protein
MTMMQLYGNLGGFSRVKPEMAESMAAWLAAWCVMPVATSLALRTFHFLPGCNSHDVNRDVSAQVRGVDFDLPILILILIFLVMSH